MLLPLDCHTAETGELVNGGRSPFILTVDMCGRLCYSVQKILSLYSEFQKANFNQRRKIPLPVRMFCGEKSTVQKSVPTWHELFLKKNSVQLGQNFSKNTSRQIVGNKKRLPTKLVGSQKSFFCPTMTEVQKLGSSPAATTKIRKSQEVF